MSVRKPEAINIAPLERRNTCQRLVSEAKKKSNPNGTKRHFRFGMNLFVAKKERVVALSEVDFEDCEKAGEGSA